MRSEHSSRGTGATWIHGQTPSGEGALRDEAVAWRRGSELPASRPRTLPELVARCVDGFGDAVVLVDGGRRCSWRDLDCWSGRLAARLADRLAPGARLAILCGNGLPHLLAELAAWRLGAVAVPIFAGYGEARLRELLALIEPAVVLADRPGPVADASLPLSPAALLELAFAPGGSSDRAVGAETPCLIQFTSGSTGTPRGVVLGHDNLCSQQAAFAMLWPEIGPGDRLAAYLPWHHSFGSLAERLWALARGASLRVVPGGGRDRELLLATVREVRPTVFMSVPKVHALATQADLFAPGSLRWAFTAGAPLGDELYGWYERRGIPIYEGWGLTEASPSCTITAPGSPRVPGVVGEPIPGVEVGVRARDGRILVRGPNVMRGYFRQDAPCLHEGILDSGDQGAWTEAGLRLGGRADHQLKLANGEKVCAAAIEAALHAQAAVQHAVVTVDGDLVAVIEPAPGHGASQVLEAVRLVNAGQAIPYQRVAEVVLAHEAMTVENGQLTASLKVSRGRVLAALRSWRVAGGGGFERFSCR
jgi:long-subunit acyl-CoA synthetase (AMP-forming)